MRKVVILSFVAFIAAVLSGCGQSGPLYLSAPQDSTTASASEAHHGHSQAHAKAAEHHRQRALQHAATS